MSEMQESDKVAKKTAELEKSQSELQKTLREKQALEAMISRLKEELTKVNHSFKSLLHTRGSDYLLWKMCQIFLNGNIFSRLICLLLNDIVWVKLA